LSRLRDAVEQRFGEPLSRDCLSIVSPAHSSLVWIASVGIADEICITFALPGNARSMQ
jgi:hypothetical protein